MDGVEKTISKPPWSNYFCLADHFTETWRLAGHLQQNNVWNKQIPKI